MHVNKLQNHWVPDASAAAAASWLPCLQLEDHSRLLLESRKAEVTALLFCCGASCWVSQPYLIILNQSLPGTSCIVSLRAVDCQGFAQDSRLKAILHLFVLKRSRNNLRLSRLQLCTGKYDLVSQLLAAKEASGKTFTQISEEIGLTNAFTAQLFHNQVCDSTCTHLPAGCTNCT